MSDRFSYSTTSDESSVPSTPRPDTGGRGAQGQGIQLTIQNLQRVSVSNKSKITVSASKASYIELGVPSSLPVPYCCSGQS
ncbi:hypothetical protein PoB_007470000 [Plakobranchus ocellatus]|uniref:Uncharacterized protein n=1 Tax=Plakobranchus ocellatus TaxID=259542 RepID=A0AAV4DVU9_9GAST|nr:hypothetical protein PoB_007470000 [Plakobranchus ocellatus]